MTKLEERGLQLTTAVSLLNTVTSFNKLPGSLGRILTEKMKKTEERNPGLETVKNVSGILQVEMDVIKKEPDINPLQIQPSDIEDKKPLSEEGNLLNLQVTRIKEECVDESYDHTSEIKFEEIILPDNFPEHWSGSHLRQYDRRWVPAGRPEDMRM
ncbi:uncharacterized protein [Periplaneta americana]|uniref:uncharacterized protein isoform X6 n=1 Tax=Periplaneta americana TaxID=6978 RepID=UPI0037E8B574